MAGAPFDHVVAAAPDGTPRTLSVAAFLALPLAQRIGLVLGGRLRFFAGESEVDSRDALRWLREAAVK